MLNCFLTFSLTSIYQPHNVPAGAALLCDDEIGVLFAYNGSAYLQPLESRAVNHRPGRQPARVFEYAAGIYRIQRLVVLLVNPYFLNASA